MVDSTRSDLDMANLIARAQKDDASKTIPLPRVQAEVIVDGAFVSFRVNMDEIAAVAIERDGIKEDGVTQYVKNPAVMLVAKATKVQVCQVNPADGIEYMLEVDFRLGRDDGGVYAPITRSKLIGTVDQIAKA